jgi:hypothetical protein
LSDNNFARYEEIGTETTTEIRCSQG